MARSVASALPSARSRSSTETRPPTRPVDAAELDAILNDSVAAHTPHAAANVAAPLGTSSNAAPIGGGGMTPEALAANLRWLKQKHDMENLIEEAASQSKLCRAMAMEASELRGCDVLTSGSDDEENGELDEWFSPDRQRFLEVPRRRGNSTAGRGARPIDSTSTPSLSDISPLTSSSPLPAAFAAALGGAEPNSPAGAVATSLMERLVASSSSPPQNGNEGVRGAPGPPAGAAKEAAASLMGLLSAPQSQPGAAGSSSQSGEPPSGSPLDKLKGLAAVAMGGTAAANMQPIGATRKPGLFDEEAKAALERERQLVGEAMASHGASLDGRDSIDVAGLPGVGGRSVPLLRQKDGSFVAADRAVPASDSSPSTGTLQAIGAGAAKELQGVLGGGNGEGLMSAVQSAASKGLASGGAGGGGVVANAQHLGAAAAVLGLGAGAGATAVGGAALLGAGANGQPPSSAKEILKKAEKAVKNSAAPEVAQGLLEGVREQSPEAATLLESTARDAHQRLKVAAETGSLTVDAADEDTGGRLSRRGSSRRLMDAVKGFKRVLSKEDLHGDTSGQAGRSPAEAVLSPVVPPILAGALTTGAGLLAAGGSSGKMARRRSMDKTQAPAASSSPERDDVMSDGSNPTLTDAGSNPSFGGISQSKALAATMRPVANDSLSSAVFDPQTASTDTALPHHTSAPKFNRVVSYDENDSSIIDHGPSESDDMWARARKAAEEKELAEEYEDSRLRHSGNHHLPHDVDAVVEDAYHGRPNRRNPPPAENPYLERGQSRSNLRSAGNLLAAAVQALSPRVSRPPSPPREEEAFPEPMKGSAKKSSSRRNSPGHSRTSSIASVADGVSVVADSVANFARSIEGVKRVHSRTHSRTDSNAATPPPAGLPEPPSLSPGPSPSLSPPGTGSPPPADLDAPIVLPDQRLTLAQAREDADHYGALLQERREPSMFRPWKGRLIAIVKHQMLIYRESAKKADFPVETVMLHEMRGESATLHDRQFVALLQFQDADRKRIALAFDTPRHRTDWVKAINDGKHEAHEMIRKIKLERRAKTAVRNTISRVSGMTPRKSESDAPIATSTGAPTTAANTKPPGTSTEQSPAANRLSSNPAPAQGMSEAQFRHELTATLSFHEPSRLKDVDSIVNLFRGKESQCLVQLQQRYGAPTPSYERRVAAYCARHCPEDRQQQLDELQIAKRDGKEYEAVVKPLVEKYGAPEKPRKRPAA